MAFTHGFSLTSGRTNLERGLKQHCGSWRLVAARARGRASWGNGEDREHR